VEPGLYLVATPIGNLEDITLRALRVLRGVDRIACEDTRQTQKLLNHFGITTPSVSYHEHNEQSRTAELLILLRQGGRVAVVSDAGTPTFSDPGLELVRAAVSAGVPVIPIPGANAALSALVASGLDTDRFFYVGFLAAKPGARRTELETLAAAAPFLTLVVYEAPHRILETLADVQAVWGANVRVVVARELTKMHEEFLRGTAAEVALDLSARDRVRGEIVLLIEAVPREQGVQANASVKQLVAHLTEVEGLDEKDALKRVARERGVSKSDIYRELQRQRAKK
jgi:16S rRNA (cytidine1402-2'-O)-methyltransferase